MKNIDQVARQNLAAMRQAEQAAQNLNAPWNGTIGTQRRVRRAIMSVGKKITAGYVLTLGILIIIGALSYWSTSRLISNNERWTNTHQNSDWP